MIRNKNERISKSLKVRRTKTMNEKLVKIKLKQPEDPSEFEELQKEVQIQLLSKEDKDIQSKIQQFLKFSRVKPFERKEEEYPMLKTEGNKQEEVLNKFKIFNDEEDDSAEREPRIKYITQTPRKIRFFFEDSVNEEIDSLKLEERKETEKSGIRSKKNSKRSVNSYKSVKSSIPEVIYKTVSFEKNERELLKRPNVYDSLSDDEIQNSHKFNFVIDPKTVYKWFWDLFIYILLVTSITLVPIHMAFHNGQSLCSSNYFVTSFDLVTDVAFTLDVLLYFFIGYYDFEEEIICNNRKVVSNYFFGYFLLDSIAAIPLNSFVNMNDDTLNIRWIKLIRLLKILKFIGKNKNLKHKKIFNLILKKTKIKMLLDSGMSSYMDSKFNKLMRYITYYLVLNHILTCIWIYLSVISPGKNWTYLDNLSKICNNQWSYYIASFYFTMATLFTVGYGDIYSVSIQEKIYNLVILVLGLIVYSFFVSFLSKFAVVTNPKELELERNLDYLHDISFTHQISFELFHNIRSYLKYTHKNNKESNNNFIFNLPKSLRNEIICHAHKDILTNFSFFKKSKNGDFNATVILALRPICAYKGEVLLESGDLVEEVIFIRVGVVKVFFTYKETKIKLVNLNENEHYGDYFALQNERSPVGMVVRSSKCELFLLRRQDFLKIMEDFIEIYSKILKSSIYNLKRIQKLIRTKMEIFDNQKLQFTPFANFGISTSKLNKSLISSNNITKPKMKSSDEVINDTKSQKALTSQNDKGANIAYYNYYNNYNITNEGNLFINLNVNKENEVLKSDTNCNTTIQVNGNKMPIITINQSDPVENTTNTMNSFFRKLTPRPRSSGIFDDKTFNSVTSDSINSLQGKSTTLFKRQENKGKYYSMTKNLIKSSVSSKNLTNLNSAMVKTMLENAECEDQKKLNKRLKNILMEMNQLDLNK